MILGNSRETHHHIKGTGWGHGICKKWLSASRSELHRLGLSAKLQETTIFLVKNCFFFNVTEIALPNCRTFTSNIIKPVLGGGFNLVYLPLWKMMDFVTWDDDIPNWMEKIKCSKPPTSKKNCRIKSKSFGHTRLRNDWDWCRKKAGQCQLRRQDKPTKIANVQGTGEILLHVQLSH